MEVPRGRSLADLTFERAERYGGRLRKIAASFVSRGLAPPERDGAVGEMVRGSDVAIPDGESLRGRRATDRHFAPPLPASDA